MQEITYCGDSGCSIPIIYLTENGLEWGNMVSAYVISTNAIGSSVPSVEGVSEPIYTTPSEPLDFTNDETVTNANQVGLTWSEPNFTGGTPILDYRVWQL